MESEKSIENISLEFNKPDFNKPTIGLLMMVKNESKRIHVTLNSVVGFVDALIIYDTGSTDNTIEIIKEFCETHKINLYLKHGTFVNFSVSRNVSLDFADTVDVHYLLLLDCNDELRGGKYLQMAAETLFEKPNTGFLVCQEWWSGMNDKYYNIRFIKNRNGWRYCGSVHEWMKDTLSTNDIPRFPVIRLMDEVVLYQDRTADDDKTGKRFSRDKELLLAEHKENPTEPRTLFYLAQTCQCLGQHEETLYYSKLRLEQQGFYEERFHSYMRCASSILNMKGDWHHAMMYYVKAYEEFQRAEPLAKIADYYRLLASERIKQNKPVNNLWCTAFMYIYEACQLEYPSQCNLFVDKGIYDYYRWHLLGIIAYHVQKYKEGKLACLKAIEANVNKTLDEHNLQFYLDKEKDKKETILQSTNNIMTKAQFVNNTVGELQSQYPKLKLKDLQKKALKLWKNRK